MKKLLILISVLFSFNAWAGEYYVSTTGSSGNPGTYAQPWTLAKANTTLVAGDTVYILAGTYTSNIAPNNSGTSSKRITYRNYGTDNVTIQNTSYGILFDGKSCVTVQGINFYNCDQFMYLINGSSYNIIAYCTFDHGRANNWTGSIIYQSSSYNWIHHCTFSNYGVCNASHGSGSDQGTTLDIGDEESGTDASQYNLVENCILFHGGHHVFGVFSKYNTIRNNYLHNEAWSNGRGHRNLYIQGYATNSGYVLYEGNKFGYASQPCNDASPTVASVAMSTDYNIFRYNKIYHSVSTCLTMYTYGSPYNVGAYNKIYNNTCFNTGLNIDPSYKNGSEDSGIWFAFSSTTGNQVKNNLYYLNYQIHSGYTGNQTFANNWDGNTQGNPLFVNASATPPANKTDSTLPNLDLQSNSPAIDKGGALTIVSSASGSGTSINLANASYFQDGTWAPPGTVQADWIAVGTVTNVVQISSISGNTVNLANSISWANGDSVWLYKKSDGVRVLYGAAPDAGAYEFSQSDAPSAPQNLTIISP